ncbi:aromatic alcohol reductase [Aspergillus brunneoviolaceus CBS 621.78]|uniref:NAD(P)-binding protein n=2 Tax=Aspergillus TaxID=5052 RepID=A0A8G1VXE3_9EURO|nr:NAD(P)-binding protein [Aspergillus brunneoviolaceus CBS 621.78]XP_040799176.1 NAD(P)-binding protein [Aspergillus fijiensis CBS 313.89]RAH47335.1 NAD(P)-binding protein [Aspergillus brunneoviolaceus CBS 621.78]RAK75166.1 NAD(P)-binding protein [Aspergillus fijiensis CBS 313.89]
MSEQGYKNIILVGGGGSLGSVLLKSLLSEPTFKVSVLTRESSKARASLPSTANIITIPDSYPQEDLIKAFQGQDAVVNAITSFSVAEQLKFIDAAITAGVKRFVPSEYGLDNNTPAAQELSPVFKDKGQVQAYLRSKEADGLTWTAIACGMWIGWSLRNNFLGLDYSNRTMTLTDDGTGKFSTTTLDNTALTLNRILLNPSSTANQIVFTSDFATSQKELVETIERLTGEQWQRKSINTKELIPTLKAAWEQGDAFAGYGLINIGFTQGEYSGHFEPVQPVRNKELGLPEKHLEEVVKEALAEVGHPGF